MALLSLREWFWDILNPTLPDGADHGRTGPVALPSSVAESWLIPFLLKSFLSSSEGAISHQNIGCSGQAWWPHLLLSSARHSHMLITSEVFRVTFTDILEVEFWAPSGFLGSGYLTVRHISLGNLWNWLFHHETCVSKYGESLLETTVSPGNISLSFPLLLASRTSAPAGAIISPCGVSSVLSRWCFFPRFVCESSQINFIVLLSSMDRCYYYIIIYTRKKISS